MKNYMPLDGLRCSRDSGSAHCDTPKSAVLGRPGGGVSSVSSQNKAALPYTTSLLMDIYSLDSDELFGMYHAHGKKWNNYERL